MALTPNHVTDMAMKIRNAGEELITTYWKLKEIIALNQAQSIDWGNATVPEYITASLAANGNIDGHKATPIQISNIVGSFAAVVSTIESGHIGNINSIL